jgi:ABC-2 type transport system ATP-binding protein
MTAIGIDGLVKTYGAVRALDGLDLSVDRGLIFGFLGPNGAGKTTTIRILTGLARASGGRATVAGLEVGVGRSGVARRIGHLPEEPAFYPWMTPLEFVDHIGRVLALPAADRARRVPELLEQVGLGPAMKRRIGGFSRGMRQRLGLAQALIGRPEVLFLDEPVSALDPAGRKEVLELIERLRGECTVFMSTHILADVERVCDAIGIVAKGRLVIQASRETLLARYATPVFEIESSADPSALGRWVDRLRTREWVGSASRNGDLARIVVTDVETAKRELLRLAVEDRLALDRFELVRPSLEDVFLRLVGPGPTL